MSTGLWVVFITLVISLTIYIIVYRIYPSPKNENVLSALTPLSAKKNVMMPDQVKKDIVGSGSSTVMAFFYLRQGDRTLHYSSTEQYIPIMEIENNWYLEISPSPKEKSDYGARLRVQTQQDMGTLKDEIIELPSIPKQKWIFIAILREGRRFDIIYQNQIVASQRLQNYPVVVTSPLSVGNKGLEGTVIHIRTNSRRLTPEEAERERVSHVDTNGMVSEAKLNPLHDIDILRLPALDLLSKCPNGMPCNPVTKPPSRSVFQWSSPYA